MTNQKSQIDIALTIGSIVIPVVVLLGALMFAWAMISPITNAGRTAGLVSYDISRMTDLAYSVPDHIKINYVPPSSCQIAKGASGNYFSCLGGFMNISNFAFSTERIETEFPAINSNGYIEHGTAYINSALFVTAQADFSSEATENIEIKSPVNMKYTAIADIRDVRLNLLQTLNKMSDSEDFTPMFSIDRALVIEKIRNALYDTLVKSASQLKTQSAYTTAMLAATEYDPLEQFVRLSYSACTYKTSASNYFYMPYGFYLVPNAATKELCLYKLNIFPDMNYLDNQIWNYKDDKSWTSSKVYCFDFDNMPAGCAYSISTIPSELQSPAIVNGYGHSLYTCVSGTTVSYGGDSC